MIEIKKPKSSSSFRRPYLSSSKNVKVSRTVMKTPSHRGILQKHKKYEKTVSRVFRYPKISLNYILLDSK